MYGRCKILESRSSLSMSAGNQRKREQEHETAALKKGPAETEQWKPPASFGSDWPGSSRSSPLRRISGAVSMQQSIRAKSPPVNALASTVPPQNTIKEPATEQSYTG